MTNQADATAERGSISLDAPGREPEYPVLYDVADRSSLEGQRLYKLLAGAELGLVILGATIAAVVSIFGQPERLAVVASAASFIGALLVRLTQRNRADDHAWFDGRAVAETIKTQVWKYRSRISPFDDDATADRIFGAELTATLHARPNFRPTLPRSTDHGKQITTPMRTARAAPLAERLRRYREGRLMEQAGWYGRKATSHRSLARRWSALTIGVEALAVAVAVATLAYDFDGVVGFFGLCSTAAAALTAWTQIGRHAEVARAYELAYQELLVMVSISETVQTEKELQALVLDGENAISREHTMWIAKRTEP